MRELEARERLLASAGLEGIYDPPGMLVMDKVLTGFDRHTKSFVSRATFIAAHVRDAVGEPFPLLLGGQPGFARVSDGTTLEVEIVEDAWPNDELPPSNGPYQAGLLFVVPGIKETLRMKGNVEVVPGSGDSLGKVRLHLDTTFFHCAKAFIRSKVWDAPPPDEKWKGTRAFRCIRKERESSVITSFYFVRAAGEAIPKFAPGQHVQVEVPVPGHAGPLRRSYSLSCAPNQEFIRISVKREAPPAIVSGFLTDNVEVGSMVNLAYPSGRFMLNEESERPVVMLSAGVGLTPMIAILEHLVATGSKRQIWFFHAAVSGKEHAMGAHVRGLAERNENIHARFCYGRPSTNDRLYGSFDYEGRLSLDMLKRALPWDDYEFYICGPGPFMTALIDELRAHGVSPDRIRWEAFGPGAPVISTADIAQPSPSTNAVQVANSNSSCTVRFARAGKVVQWKEGDKSLLDIAEENQIPVRSVCRSGECLTCSTRILSGEVAYPVEPPEEPEEGSVLMCLAVPRGPVMLDV